MPDTNALLILTWSRFLIKYPKDAKDKITASSLNRNRLSIGQSISVQTKHWIDCTYLPGSYQTYPKSTTAMSA